MSSMGYIFLTLLLQLCLGLASSYRSNTLDDFPGLADLVLPSAVQTRVVGGEVTTIDKVGGFLVALLYGPKFVCGGTLLQDRIVVSAAHCFLGRKNSSRWTVQGGVTTLDEVGYTVQVQDFLTPTSFTEKAMHMDVAVLLLAKPLEGKDIAPAKLCERNLTEGLQLQVSGWGLIDPKDKLHQQTMRTVTVPIIKKSKCRKVYKASVNISDSMFCAGVLGEKDACTFDSGGPLVYETTAPKELCGIVSFGISCASPKFPGVYTDVNYVRPFIEASIKSLLGN